MGVGNKAGSDVVGKMSQGFGGEEGRGERGRWWGGFRNGPAHTREDEAIQRKTRAGKSRKENAFDAA